MKRFGNFLIPLIDAVLTVGKSDFFFLLRNDKEDLISVLGFDWARSATFG
jgi:hypothetical protein